MRRVAIEPRPNWRSIVESQGLSFHSQGEIPYWDERACYLFTADEIDEIEEAVVELERLCLVAVDHVIRFDRFEELEIPPEFARWATASWERGERSLYGRFDLSYRGDSPPKMLEYNADTPTSLIEAAVIQWYWLQDRRQPELDQFNSLHERLIEGWAELAEDHGGSLHLCGVSASEEDANTLVYLQDTASQAGFTTQLLDINEVGWNRKRRQFIDLAEQPIRSMFKLYPWEWMIRETFGPNLLESGTRWIEPPWKMILSNKAILPILWELFPDHPNLLRASLTPFSDTFVSKPILAREGANVTIMLDGLIVARSDGDYDGTRVYQEFHPLPDFGGRHPVLGGWVVRGQACGMGIREDDGPITRNGSRFIPHAFTE